MKINKMLFYYSMVINILLLIISSILYFNFKDNYTMTFVVNILLNIFAGSVILSITSLVSYFIYRRNLLRDIMNECLKYSRIFSELEFYLPKKYNDDDLNTINVKNKKQFVKSYKKDLEKDNNDKLNTILYKYIKVSEIGTRELWDLYDDLDFITDIKHKKKKEYWKNIFNYIYSNINLVKEYSYHFKIFVSSMNLYYPVAEEKLCKLQSKIFFNKTYNYENDNVEDIISNIEVGYETVSGGQSKEYMLIYNEISNYLLKMFEAVGKDNYFDKNYKGLGSDEND